MANYRVDRRPALLRLHEESERRRHDVFTAVIADGIESGHVGRHAEPVRKVDAHAAAIRDQRRSDSGASDPTVAKADFAVGNKTMRIASDDFQAAGRIREAGASEGRIATLSEGAGVFRNANQGRAAEIGMRASSAEPCEADSSFAQNRAPLNAVRRIFKLSVLRRGSC